MFQLPSCSVLSNLGMHEALSNVFEPRTSALECPRCGETIASSKLEDQHGDFFGNYSFLATSAHP